MQDATRVIAAVARRYADPSCFALNRDDLEAEGRAKLARLIHDGWLTRARSRAEFFRVFKTSVSNHIITLMMRNRLTQKRMGSALSEGGKPEVELDERWHQSLADDGPDGSSELLQDMRARLSPAECLVFDGLVQPDHATMLEATMAAFRGRKRGTPLAIKVTLEHRARALGLDPRTYIRLRRSLRQKLKMNRDHVPYNQAVRRLADFFGVQVPPATDSKVVARLFSLCARDQHERVDEAMRADLQAIGAVAPTYHADGSLVCYGVLFERTHRVCNACVVRDKCQAECARHGLGEIPVTDRLGAAKTMRYAVLQVDDAVPAPQDAAALTPATEAQSAAQQRSRASMAAIVARRITPQSTLDEQVIAYLNRQLRCVVYHGEVYWKHRTTVDRTRLIFWAGPVPGRSPFNLRFCSVSPALQASLERHERSWYLPADMAPERAIALIDRHAQETERRQQWVAVRTARRYRAAPAAPVAP